MDLNEERAGIKTEYHRYTLRKIIFILACCIVVIAVGGTAMTLGSRDIGFFDVYRVLFDHMNGATYQLGTTEWWDDYIVWDSRLPRILMAVIAGAGLGIGGAAMQGVMKNPLADPYTTGISSGAILGVTFAMVLGFTVGPGISQYGIILNAFLFGLIPAGVMIFVSRFTRTSPVTMILAGIALSYLFNALSTLILVTADAEDVADAYLWQIGTLENIMWSDLPLVFVVTVAGSVFLYIASKKLNLLSLGDESARSLGLNVDNFRILCLAVISLITASIISYTGIIGFVGLIAPHIVRMFIGGDNRFVMPASLVFGAALLLVADVIARTIVSPGELPVGIIMSFIGGPLFLFLIIRQRKEVW
ncbi:MAG: iron ABC transporter permease [Candidatus Methanoplasma sp.]|nr:iron ABC transporter permease [Candidatus Methanoplasma sp.]